MVKISLQISCAFENVESLKAGPECSYFLKIRCNNCGESDGKFHPVDINETFGNGESWQNFLLSVKNSQFDKISSDSRNEKGSHFMQKCKMCSRENSLEIVEGSQGEFH